MNRLLCSLAFWSMPFSVVFAQNAVFDPTFNPSDEGMARFDGLFPHDYAPDEGVRYMTVQADGKLLIGGYFTGGVLGINDPVTKPGIARLNTDGSQDLTFDPGTGVDGAVEVIVVQPDGKILVGGTFLQFDGAPRKGIARLNPDGSLDGSFNVGSGATGTVLEIAVQLDGRILLGGSFTSFDGTPAVRIVRLLSTGAVDPTFATGTGFDGLVRAIAVQADGNVLVGGHFTHYQGTGRNYLARLSSTGVLDAFYNDNTLMVGPGGALFDIVVGNAGSAFISGTFNTYNGTEVGSDPIKLDVNGAWISTFHISELVGTSRLFYHAASNRLSCMGGLGITHAVNGNTGTGGYGYFNYLYDWYYRINCSFFITYWQNGTVGPNGEVYRLDPIHLGILRLNNDLTLDPDFHINRGLGYFNGGYGMTMDDLGQVTIAGRVDNLNTLPAFNGQYQPNAYRLTSEGEFDPSFTMAYGFEGKITDVISMGSDKVVMAGPLTLTCAPGSFASYVNCPLLMVDQGSGDLTPLVPGGCSSGVDDEIKDMLRCNSGQLLYAGQYDCGGAPKDIGRFSAAGVWDGAYITTDLGPTNELPECLAEAPDGKVYVAGNFTNANGSSRNRIVRLLVNGGVDPTFDPLGGFNGRVRDMVVNPDGTVVCIGDFTSYRGLPAPKITKLLPNGAPDPSFTPGTGISNTPIRILRYPDGRLVIGGAIPMYDGTIVNGIVCINADGTIDPTFDQGDGFRINNAGPGGGVLYDMELQPDGKLVCLGEFHMYDGNGRNRICRIGTGESVRLMARVLLEGPYSAAGMMSNALGASTIPLSEPYRALGFTVLGGGSESISPSVLLQQGPQAVVDWILVELRDAQDPAHIVATRSGLLLADGSIVDTDGQSALRFFGTGMGAYYIAVRHRNHLGVMTEAPVFLGSAPMQLDLTSPNFPTYGSNSRKSIGNDLVLWAGDVNHDGQLKYTGENNDRDPILSRIGGVLPTATATGYHAEDVNLDGTVKYTGEGNDRDPILQNIGGTVPTNTREGQLP
jgi:uncharacterized delta-60 repeat protein